MKRFLTLARIWILALPLFIGLVGAASNQLVLAANHDKFPVMLNGRRAAKYTNDEPIHECFLGGLVCIDKPKSDGMIDDIHCLMTDSTRLNWLADWIDLQSGTYSPGDLLLEVAYFLWGYAPIVWLTLILSDLARRSKYDHECGD